MTHPEIAQALRVDRICTQFEEELKANRAPRIEFYLDNYSGEIKQDLLKELLALELWYARERNHSLSIIDFLERFPGYDAIVRECFSQDALPPSPDPDRMRSTADTSNLESAGYGSSREHALNASIELPSQFGRYRIVKRLGEGGMGNVFLAEDESLDRQIALKVPRLSRANGAGILGRFRREAQAAARILHPNLCPVYDIGEIDGIFFLTMAYIEGQSLAEHLLQRRPINVHNAIAVIRKTAQALSEAHAQGVIHRDLKPSNIMINLRGEPVVVDFGLARTDVSELTRLTASHAMVGTPAYASPEQLECESEVDPRSDVYSLGVILFELLTGRLPFQASSPLMLLQRILENDPKPPSTVRANIPKELDEICLKAIAKQPEERYQSMQEFDEALAGCGALVAQTENSRPDWFRRTANQASVPLANGSLHTRTMDPTSTPPASEDSRRWTVRAKTYWGQTTRKMKGLTALKSQFPWLVTLSVIVICGSILLSKPEDKGPAPPSRKVADASPLSEPNIPGGANSHPLAPSLGGPIDVDEGDEGNKPQTVEGPAEVTSSQPIDPPEYRVQLPAPVRGWTVLSGSLWHAGLKQEDPLRYHIKMRCVESRMVPDESGKTYPFQVLEIDVTTLNNLHQEQASLLVDVQKYRDDHELHIEDGWISAPREQVAVEYNGNRDALAQEFSNRGAKLPEVRLSVQDVLALLFNAKTNVQTTYDKYRTMQDNLRDVRLLNSQNLDVLRPKPGTSKQFTLIKTKPSVGGKAKPVSYSIEIGEDSRNIPFNWGNSVIEYRPQGQLAFSATLSHLGGGIREENVAEFNVPEWDPVRDPPPPHREYAYLNLPEEEGIFCQFEVLLKVRGLSTMKLNRVEVRVLEQEIIDDRTYRWIEVEVQTGEDFLPNKLVETVRLLVDQELYQNQNERKFVFLQDENRLQYQAVAQLQVGHKPPLYVRFDPYIDRMDECYREKIYEYQKEIIQGSPHADLEMVHRLPIRNVLSLLFDAELTPHIMKFNIRKHISNALTDAGMMRYSVKNKIIPITPDRKDDLLCQLIHPGRSVSIVANNASKLGPTTLTYDIYICQDASQFPFRWVDMTLDLFEEENDLPGDQIFGGRLKLRRFGKLAGSSSPQPLKGMVQEIVETKDPGEERALLVMKKYREEAEQQALRGDYKEAIELYEKGIAAITGNKEKEVETAMVAVSRAHGRIEVFKKKLK